MDELLPSREGNIGEIVSFSVVKGIGNSTIKDKISNFRKLGMEGPRAAQQLLSLFEPFSATKDDLELLRPSEKNPENLWDQVGWAFTSSDLTPAQKDATYGLQYALLDSLANVMESHKVKGELRDLGREVKDTAQKTFEEYGAHLQKVLDPEDPTSAKILDVSGLIAKVGVRVSPLLLAAACGLKVMPFAQESNLPNQNVAHASINGGDIKAGQIVPSSTETATPPPTKTSEPYSSLNTTVHVPEGWIKDPPKPTSWQDASGKTVNGYIDEKGVRHQFLTYFDVINKNAKIGETGYDYGVVALNVQGTNIIHRVAGYYTTLTFDTDLHYYLVYYFPIEVPTPNN